MRRQGRRGSRWAGEAAAWPGSSSHGGRVGGRAEEAVNGPGRQRLDRGAAAAEEGAEEAGPEMQQMGREPAASEERVEGRAGEAANGLERQQLGWGGSGLWRKGWRQGWRQGRRDSGRAGEATAGPGSSGHEGRGRRSRAGETAGGPERQQLDQRAAAVKEGDEEAGPERQR